MSRDAGTPTTCVFFGNLSPDVDRELLYDIGIQAGPIIDVTVPMDSENGNRSKGFGFVVRVNTEFEFEFLVFLFEERLFFWLWFSLDTCMLVC